MLSEEEKQELAEEIGRYRYKQALSVEALKIVQKHRGGWVTDEALRDVAEYLSMSPAEVESVATFYNMVFRRPVGRHIILICNSVSCWIMGYESLYAHLRSRLGIDFGETTADGRFTLLPIVCLGACHLAPVMMIDEDLHGNLTPAKIDAVLAEYL